MRVLVFGGDGQLGQEFRRLGGRDGHQVIALTKNQADITQPAVAAAAIRDAGADAVVNAAAFTAVDRAESEPELAYSVNRDGARHVAAACANQALPMVHISTDYVFDGGKQGAYVPDDPVAPMGVYGASKEAGEQAVREAHDGHVILRTSWVFGVSGSNFVKTMLRLGAEREELAVVGDQTGCPTPARDLAAAILDMLPVLEKERRGTYHYCGAGRTSWYDFAKEIFDLREGITGAPPPRLRAIATAEYPTPAARPANSELDCSDFAAAFGFAPRSWKPGLAEVMDQLLTA